MDRPSTSRQSVEKVEMFEVREHVPYQAELTRAPAAYDEESGDIYDSSWLSAFRAICQLINLLHHMQIAIVVFSVWHFALTSAPNGTISNLELHIIFAGTGYQLFLVEAVLTLNKHNAWSFQLSKDAKRIVHGCLQLIGSLFVLAGTFLGLARVDMVVSSAHGICGVIALAFTMASFISGVVALFSAKVRMMVKSGPVKILHLAVGLFAVSMGLITMVIGFNMDYFAATRGGLSTALMSFTILILLYVMIQPIVDLIATTKKSM
uniref:ascorbate ferrireductase (transmembrane) n=1 Tax=Heliothis virescens TaxID=7102 RepID=A0A2A4K6B6_HELVI